MPYNLPAPVPHPPHSPQRPPRPSRSVTYRPSPSLGPPPGRGATRAARHRFSLTDASLGRRGAAEVLGGPSLDSFRDADGAILRRALAHANGNATQAAKALGIGRATLYRRMDRAGISRG